MSVLHKNGAVIVIVVLAFGGGLLLGRYQLDRSSAEDYMYGPSEEVIEAFQAKVRSAQASYDAVAMMLVDYRGRPPIKEERKLLMLRLVSESDLFFELTRSLALGAIVDESAEVRRECVLMLMQYAAELEGAEHMISRNIGLEADASVRGLKEEMMRQLMKPAADSITEPEHRGLTRQENGLPHGLREVSDASYPSVAGLASGSEEAQDRQRQAVESMGLPLEVQCAYTRMRFRLIPDGDYEMGGDMSPSQVVSRFGGVEQMYHNEHPRRSVKISQPFYMAVHEVTQAQYEMIMGHNPSPIRGRDLPVAQVSWNDAMEFVRRLSQHTGLKVSLPTEAQWEYAARAGTSAAYYFGNDASKLEDYAWFGNSSLGRVGQKKPNAWGLYDMHGSVWEWCLDWYQDSYHGLAAVDPDGPASGDCRILRGGSWINDDYLCRSAYRSWLEPDGKSFTEGFRVCLMGVK